MKVNADFLPCPWCGKRPTIEHWPGQSCWYVACERSRCPCNPTMIARSRVVLLRRWNTRLHRPALPQEVADLLAVAKAIAYPATFGPRVMADRVGRLRWALGRVKHTKDGTI